MEFAFTAKSRNGVNESGKLIADTLDEARSRLRTQGLFPLDVRVSTASGEQKTLSLSFSRKGVKKKRHPDADVSAFDHVSGGN